MLALQGRPPRAISWSSPSSGETLLPRSRRKDGALVTGAATPLTIWAAAVLLGRIGAGDDDLEDERHILRGIE